MSFLFPELCPDRRQVMGAGVGALSALALGSAAAAQGDNAQTWTLDDPATNLLTLLKFRADTSGADVLAAFPGEAWSMVPEEGNRRLFKTFGIGSSHIEERPEGWRVYHREVLYYLDPETGEIVNEWYNPWLERKIEVIPIVNDPVNGTFLREGTGVLAAPYPYVAYGDDIIFQWNFFLFHKSVLTREEYPLYSQSNYQQHAELWGVQGRRSQAMDPNVTSASSTTSWSRVAPWMPWLEMGNRPGIVVYHSHSYKVTGGPGDLPPKILAYTEKNYPDYLTSPKEWVDPSGNQSSYVGFKKIIDARRAAAQQPAGTP